MAPSWIQILIVVVLLVLLFGRGKISDLMGDVAKGIKSFKKGIQDEPEQNAKDDHLKTIAHRETEIAEPATKVERDAAKS